MIYVLDVIYNIIITLIWTHDDFPVRCVKEPEAFSGNFSCRRLGKTGTFSGTWSWTRSFSNNFRDGHPYHFHRSWSIPPSCLFSPRNHSLVNFLHIFWTCLDHFIGCVVWIKGLYRTKNTNVGMTIAEAAVFYFLALLGFSRTRPCGGVHYFWDTPYHNNDGKNDMIWYTIYEIQYDIDL